MMKWFAPEPALPGCEGNERVPIPLGRKCVWCEEEISANASGYMIPYIEDRGEVFPGAPEVAWHRPWHIECFIRSVVGSVGHQQRVCSCYGGHASDIEGQTKRQAAIAAYTLFQNRMNGGHPLYDSPPSRQAGQWRAFRPFSFNR